MFNYKVFDVHIKSTVLIPFLIADEYEVDENFLLIDHQTDFAPEYSYVNFLGMKYSGELRAYDTEKKTLLYYENHIVLAISKSGNHITIICKTKDLKEALLYCFTSGIIMSLYYRKNFILHAASFEYNEKIHALVGDSGVGKSTLLLSLLKQQVKIHSDDITAIDLFGDVLPNGSLPYKIHNNSMWLLENVSYKKKKMISGLNKYWVRLENEKVSKSKRKLSTIFILKPYNNYNTSAITAKELTLVESIEHIISNLHAFWCLPAKIKYQLIKDLEKIYDQSNIVFLYYPKRFEMLEKVSEFILTYIQSCRGDI